MEGYVISTFFGPRPNRPIGIDGDEIAKREAESDPLVGGVSFVTPSRLVDAKKASTYKKMALLLRSIFRYPSKFPDDDRIAQSRIGTCVEGRLSLPINAFRRNGKGGFEDRPVGCWGYLRFEMIFGDAESVFAQAKIGLLDAGYLWLPINFL